MTEIELLTALLQYVGMTLTVMGVFFTGGKTMRSRETGFICSCTGCIVWIAWGVMIALSSSLVAIGGLLFTNIVAFAFSVRGLFNNAGNKIEVL